jgi:membrane protein
MGRIQDWIRNIVKFFTKDLWRTDVAGQKGLKGIYYKSLRIIYLAGKGFDKDDGFLRASALTYFSILSIVPVLAMAFVVAQGFGFGLAWTDWIRENLGAQPEVMEEIIIFVNNLLENVNTGVIAGTGLIILIWTVLQLLNNIESSLNIIFGTSKPRTWIRKFTDYLTIVIFAPILIFISTGITFFFTRQIEALIALLEIERYVQPLVAFAIQLVPYILIWLMLTLVYLILPNLKVRFSSALIAGVFAGALYQLAQWIYISFQIGVTRFGAIYSTFAALPLFMIWLQVSWFIFLFGAEMASAHQNLEKYMAEKEEIIISPMQKKLLALAILKVIIRQFRLGDPPLTAIGISQLTEIPENFVSHILYSLLNIHLICLTMSDSQEQAYLPCQDIDRYDVGFVLSKFETENSSDKPFLAAEGLKEFEKIINDIVAANGQSPLNKKLKDLI